MFIYAIGFLFIWFCVYVCVCVSQVEVKRAIPRSRIGPSGEIIPLSSVPTMSFQQAGATGRSGSGGGDLAKKSVTVVSVAAAAAAAQALDNSNSNNNNNNSNSRLLKTASTPRTATFSYAAALKVGTSPALVAVTSALASSSTGPASGSGSDDALSDDISTETDGADAGAETRSVPASGTIATTGMS